MFFFCFKQKTAYEMRISDWSSDVCSSDLDEAGKTGHGRIDLYKRGCFVLEAKQSRQKGGAKEVALPASQETLPGLAAAPARGRRSAHRGWDVLMRNAREQAEQYARDRKSTRLNYSN